MRDCVIRVRLTREEKDEIEQQADVAAISVSEYMRRRILGRSVKAKLDLRILAELRRQGGLLKHLYNETRRVYSEELSKAIRANEAYYHEMKKYVTKNTRGGDVP